MSSRVALSVVIVLALQVVGVGALALVADERLRLIEMRAGAVDALAAEIDALPSSIGREFGALGDLEHDLEELTAQLQAIDHRLGNMEGAISQLSPDDPDLFAPTTSDLMAAVDDVSLAVEGLSFSIGSVQSTVDAIEQDLAFGPIETWSHGDIYSKLGLMEIDLSRICSAVGTFC